MSYRKTIGELRMMTVSQLREYRSDMFAVAYGMADFNIMPDGWEEQRALISAEFKNRDIPEVIPCRYNDNLPF